MYEWSTRTRSFNTSQVSSSYKKSTRQTPWARTSQNETHLLLLKKKFTLSLNPVNDPNKKQPRGLPVIIECQTNQQCRTTHQVQDIVQYTSTAISNNSDNHCLHQKISSVAPLSYVGPSKLFSSPLHQQLVIYRSHSLLSAVASKISSTTVLKAAEPILINESDPREEQIPGRPIKFNTLTTLNTTSSEVETSGNFLSKMKEEKTMEFIAKSLVAGGLAGMTAKTTVAPLDRIKILLQAHSVHYKHLGVFSGLRGIVQKERFLALYKGNGAQVRIFPYASIQFTSFEMYRKLFGDKSHAARFLAGSAAGVTAVSVTFPLDTIRARLAFQVSGEHLYNGIYQCATYMFRQEGGIRALYRGFTPTIVGMVPYAGSSFYFFENFKYLCMKYFPKITCAKHETNTGGLVLLLPFKLLSGGVSGAIAQTLSYPLDVCRRRMQLAMIDESTRKFGMGMVRCLSIIYQENGVARGLYRGMSINYLRAIPMVAVSFTTYELVKQLLNLDTGLPIKTG